MGWDGMGWDGMGWDVRLVSRSAFIKRTPRGLSNFLEGQDIKAGLNVYVPL